MRSRDPYEVLGISPDATNAEIRSAFRERVRASHPDTKSSSGDDGDVIAVVEAYRQLMGPAAPVEGSASGATGSRRRVEVRQVPTEHVEPREARRCPACRGAGVIERSSVCPDCGGAGSITRLEAHQARVDRCRRCRGRGRAVDHDPCGVCSGSGRISGTRQ